MMNALHLLWIIPLSSFFGFFMASLMQAASNADKKTEKLLSDKQKS